MYCLEDTYRRISLKENFSIFSRAPTILLGKIRYSKPVLLKDVCRNFEEQSCRMHNAIRVEILLSCSGVSEILCGWLVHFCQ